MEVLESYYIGLIPVFVPITVKLVKMFIEQVLVGRVPAWGLQTLSAGFGAVATAFEPFSGLDAMTGAVLGLSGIGAHQVYSHALDTKKKK